MFVYSHCKPAFALPHLWTRILEERSVDTRSVHLGVGSVNIVVKAMGLHELPRKYIQLEVKYTQDRVLSEANI